MSKSVTSSWDDRDHSSEKMIELSDKSLLRPEEAFIEGEWVSGKTTFDVLGKPSRPPHSHSTNG